ncbi:MAG: HI0074 family nucleotidyltransferase substrate-binding subunit [Bacteroidota bacterium]
MATPSPSKLETAGIVQAFEFTFEIAWKTLKDFLESKDVVISYSRDIIKEAFRAQLIENGETWLDMLDKRNLMSHTYNEENAAAAIKLIREKYFSAIKDVYDSLSKIA